MAVIAAEPAAQCQRETQTGLKPQPWKAGFPGTGPSFKPTLLRPLMQHLPSAEIRQMTTCVAWSPYRNIAMWAPYVPTVCGL